MSENKNWVTVKVPKNMIDRVAKILKTKKAKRLGYLNKSNFIVSAIRKEVEKFE